ncbi:MAG: AMP-binding protein, partial [Pseudomonadota bacterium]
MSVRPPDGFTHLSLSRGIRTSAVRMPTKVAIESANGILSYAQLVERMDRLGAAAEADWALSAGDVVALIAPNRLEYLEIVAGLSD